MLSIWQSVVSLFRKKQASEAEAKDEMPISIKNALEGNWDMVKPSTCQPPSSREDAQALRDTDDQLDTSLLSSSLSHRYNTAAEKGDHDGSDLEEFILAEKLVEEFPDGVDIPEKMCDNLIFCTSKGQFKNIRSALKWMKNENNKNRLDCEAQISMREMTDESNLLVEHTALTSCGLHESAETTINNSDLRTDSPTIMQEAADSTLCENRKCNSMPSSITDSRSKVFGLPTLKHIKIGEIFLKK